MALMGDIFSKTLPTPKNRFKPQGPTHTVDELKRRRREKILVVFLLIITIALTWVAHNLIDFGPDIPISNTILMFSLMNLNLLLILLMLFLVFRNLVKLLYDRRRKVMGAKLRTRLVAAFMALSLIPASVLFLFSIGFIKTSIEFWFNAPVEQALEKSRDVGRNIYQRMERNHRFFLNDMAYQVTAKKLMARGKESALKNYIQVVQRSFNLDAVDIYNPRAQRIFLSTREEIAKDPIGPVSADQLLHNNAPQALISITQNHRGVEYYSTIGRIPLDAAPENKTAVIVISSILPKEMTENLAAITKGINEYQQIKLLKQPVKISYYITLSVVALLVIFFALWFGFYLAKSITTPIQEIAEGVEQVADGDLEITVAPAVDEELAHLVNAFNRMTRDLRISHKQLEASSERLIEQNREIEASRTYIATVLRNVSAGVVSLDAEGTVRTINKSAEKMLHVDVAKVLERNYRELLSPRHLALSEAMLDDLNHSSSRTIEQPLHLTINGAPCSFMVHLSALIDETGDSKGVVAVFDDLTELEKAQRMAAWREVARRIAHEVKNPLTPIALSAQRLKRRYAKQLNEPVFNECTQMIINHVDLIRNLVNEFSTFARFPAANPTPNQIAGIVEETLALFREGHPEIHFTLTADEVLPPLNLDRQQIKQALINLVGNAVAALKNKGRIMITLSKDTILSLVRLEVADDGPGIPDQDKIRLFEPNFSTKAGGMGLGLTIVNAIVSDHKGMIRVVDNQPRGTKFIVELPYMA